MVKQVVAALMVRGEEILCCQRTEYQALPLKWEFPGGKIEREETPQQALVRELREELAIEATVGREVARYSHDYPNGASVVLFFYAVTSFEGEPDGRVFEQIQWTERTLLPELDFLDGDIDFVHRLARGEFEITLL
jgi:8-oxo-dGTP diphosphatase